MTEFFLLQLPEGWKEREWLPTVSISVVQNANKKSVTSMNYSSYLTYSQKHKSPNYVIRKRRSDGNVNARFQEVEQQPKLKPNYIDSVSDDISFNGTNTIKLFGSNKTKNIQSGIISNRKSLIMSTTPIEVYENGVPMDPYYTPAIWKNLTKSFGRTIFRQNAAGYINTTPIDPIQNKTHGTQHQKSRSWVQISPVLNLISLNKSHSFHDTLEFQQGNKLEHLEEALENVARIHSSEKSVPVETNSSFLYEDQNSVSYSVEVTGPSLLHGREQESASLDQQASTNLSHIIEMYHKLKENQRPRSGLTQRQIVSKSKEILYQKNAVVHDYFDAYADRNSGSAFRSTTKKFSDLNEPSMNQSMFVSTSKDEVIEDKFLQEDELDLRNALNYSSIQIPGRLSLFSVNNLQNLSNLETINMVNTEIETNSSSNMTILPIKNDNNSGKDSIIILKNINGTSPLAESLSQNTTMEENQYSDDRKLGQNTNSTVMTNHSLPASNMPNRNNESYVSPLTTWQGNGTESDPTGWTTGAKPNQGSVYNQVRYSSCEMYIDSQDLSKGTKPCVYGYMFSLQKNEWSISAEVGN